MYVILNDSLWFPLESISSCICRWRDCSLAHLGRGFCSRLSERTKKLGTKYIKIESWRKWRCGYSGTGRWYGKRASLTMSGLWASSKIIAVSSTKVSIFYMVFSWKSFSLSFLFIVLRWELKKGKSNACKKKKKLSACFFSLSLYG